MATTASSATERDLPAIVALFEDMAAFYGDDERRQGAAQGRTARVRAALFGDRPAATVLLARAGDRLLGMAAYTFHWPAGDGTSLFLKELYVLPGRRGQGVGTLLMTELFEVARREGCRRVEWTADRSNEQAQRFYARQGYRINPEKAFYRVEL